MLLRGVAHVHSTYSYDGCHPLADLAAFFRSEGLDFVLMSEHNRGLTDERVSAFVAECAALTDARLLVVPGLECEAAPDWVHVLGFNVRGLITTRSAPAIVEAIRSAGGFAALAHPHHRDASALVDAATISRLQGWEVWNGKADGGRTPRGTSLDVYTALRPSHPHLMPLGGADLHRLESYPGICLEVDSRERTADSILGGLAAGTFRVTGRSFAFSARDPLAASMLPSGGTAAVLARTAKRWGQRLDRRLSRAGVQLPQPVYRLVRRFLR
jgi:hypothetical protein